MPSLFQYEIEHTCLLKVRGKKIASVKNLITFIFFFHFFHPSSLEFERKGEENTIIAQNVSPGCSVLWEGRSSVGASWSEVLLKANWAKKLKEMRTLQQKGKKKY